ncbi:sugar ABC transporter substrate-binding protein [Oricola sp.]|uniref:sugar ABC transporter substrate-binding protein n=1 Tax=Oricola sp. TaxID=1979950 RepID=UPI003BA9CDEB
MRKSALFRHPKASLCAALFALAGSSVAALAEDINLTFVGPEAPSAMEGVIALFEKENPGIKVTYENVPFNDLNSIIQTRVGGGDPDPDIYTADQPRIASLVKRGQLLDLSTHIDKIEGVIQSSLDASTVDGKLYALPISTSSQLLYYNKKLLKAAGLDMPSIDPANRMTWEEIRTAGVKAQEAGAEFGFMWDQINRYYQLQPLAESAGGGSGIGPGQLDIDVTNDGWLKAMTFYAAAFNDGLAPRGVQPGQTQDIFANGQIAYFVGGPWWLPLFADAEGLEFGVAPHPYFEGGEQVTPTGAWSWGVNPNSDNVEAAVKFVKFAALDPKGALATAKGFPLPPANETTFDTYYAENQTVEGVADLIKSELVNTSRIRPRTTGYVEFEEFMGKAFEDIRNGANPADALGTAQSAIKRAWSRN